MNNNYKNIKYKIIVYKIDIIPKARGKDVVRTDLKTYHNIKLSDISKKNIEIKQKYKAWNIYTDIIKENYNFKGVFVHDNI